MLYDWETEEGDDTEKSFQEIALRHYSQWLKRNRGHRRQDPRCMMCKDALKYGSEVPKSRWETSPRVVEND